MDKLQEKLVRSGLKLSSAKKYINHYCSASQTAGHTLDSVKQYCENKKSISSILVSIIKCARLDDKPVLARECANYLSSVMSNHNNSGYSVANDKQKQDAESFPWQKVKEMDETLTAVLDTCSYKQFITWIIVRLMNEGFVLRGQDYFTTSINPNTSPNHLNLENGEWTLADYKTSKIYGTRTLKVSPETCEIIVKQRERFGITCPYLLTGLSDHSIPMTSTNFSKFLRRSDIGIGTQALRNIYVSKLMDSHVSRNVREQVAETMAHSPATQVLTYSKHSKSLDNDNSAPESMTDILDKAIKARGETLVRNLLLALL